MAAVPTTLVETDVSSYCFQIKVVLGNLKLLGDWGLVTLTPDLAPAYQILGLWRLCFNSKFLKFLLPVSQVFQLGIFLLNEPVLNGFHSSMASMVHDQVSPI